MSMVMAMAIVMAMCLPTRAKRLSRNRPHGIALALLLGGPSLALAQAVTTGDSPRQSLVIEPQLGVSLTATDNNGLQTSNRDKALVTMLSPGLHVRSDSRRLKASLDYTLNGLLYVKSKRASQAQNDLSAQALAELVDAHLFLDLRAGISQQAASAFGQQSFDPAIGAANRSEVASLAVSPYWRGIAAGAVDYELRANLAQTNTKQSISGDSRSTGVSARLAGLGRPLVNWSLQASSQQYDYKAGRNNHSASASGSLYFRPDEELQLSVTGGLERSDFLAVDRQRASTYGWSANWSPTVRTKLAADWSKHAYGDAHSLSFEHRMARSAWRISDTQSVVTGNGQGATGIGNNYDLLFLQFSSLEPDPVKRDVLVRDFLRSIGMSADATTTSGFLASAPTLQRRRDASFSLQGVRTTLTFLATYSSSRKLDAAATLQDDFANSTQVNQRGFALNLSHRLTPLASANFMFSQQRTRGDLASQASNLKSVTANWNSRLGPRSSLVLGLRRSQYDSVTSPYRENALLLNFLQRF